MVMGAAGVEGGHRTT